MRVVCVAGTRPNFIKIKPVLDALEHRSVDTTLVHTGQHYSESMSRVFFDDLGLRDPDVNLEVGSGTHAEQTARVMLAIEPVLARSEPDRVVVVGDVNSTVAAALVAAKDRIPVSHVEAGLRSGDWSMPEEINRVVTDRVSDQLFAPSQEGVDNLLAEGYPESSIHLVGNVMIDTLFANLPRAQSRLPSLRRSFELEDDYVLVTLHRPSNVDEESMLRGHLGALTELSTVAPVVFPVHPRTLARIDALGVATSHLQLVEPLGYLDFLALESASSAVLTDSGGIQEETTALGVPCITIRENTERAITISQGTNVLAGTDPDRIVKLTRTALTNGVERRCPALWDGHAADRIADAIVGRNHRPPLEP